MQSIYRLKDRLDVLGLKCDFSPEHGTDNFQKAKFKDDYKLVKPKPPGLQEGESIEDFSAAVAEYAAKLAMYNDLEAHVNTLSNRPDTETVLAVRSEIGIIDHLAELIETIVPGAKAEYFEDDYFATDWKDDRGMPLLADIVKPEPRRARKRKRKTDFINGEADLAKQRVISETEKVDLALGRLSPDRVAEINAQLDAIEARKQERLAALSSAITSAEIDAI